MLTDNGVLKMVYETGVKENNHHLYWHPLKGTSLIFLFFSFFASCRHIFIFYCAITISNHNYNYVHSKLSNSIRFVIVDFLFLLLSSLIVLYAIAVIWVLSNIFPHYVSIDTCTYVLPLIYHHHCCCYCCIQTCALARTD